MAKSTTDWTLGVSVRAAATLAATSTDATANIDLATLGADRSDPQIAILMGSSTSILVEIFGSSDGGTTIDTVPLVSYTVIADSTQTTVLTGPYRNISLTNVTGGVSGNITIKHAWRQWDIT